MKCATRFVASTALRSLGDLAGTGRRETPCGVDEGRRVQRRRERLPGVTACVQSPLQSLSTMPNRKEPKAGVVKKFEQTRPMSEAAKTAPVFVYAKS